MTASARRVLLVASHIPFREALAHVLNGEPDLWIIGQAATLAEAREMASLASMADIVVIEHRENDATAGEIALELRAANPRVSVLVLDGGCRKAPSGDAPGPGVVLLPARSAPLAEIIEAVNRLAETGIADRL